MCYWNWLNKSANSLVENWLSLYSSICSSVTFSGIHQSIVTLLLLLFYYFLKVWYEETPSSIFPLLQDTINSVLGVGAFKNHNMNIFHVLGILVGPEEHRIMTTIYCLLESYVCGLKNHSRYARIIPFYSVLVCIWCFLLFEERSAQPKNAWNEVRLHVEK